MGDSFFPLILPVMGVINKVVAYDVDDGALTQLYLAASPQVQALDIRGQYFVPIADANHGSSTGHRQDLRAQFMTWTLQELSERGFRLL